MDTIELTYSKLFDIISNQKFLLVRDSSFKYLPEEIQDIYKQHSNSCIVFEDFTPNPKYEEVMQGVEKYKATQCDVIVAVGGGSTIDVAKCIKLYSEADSKLIAIPTTAGTGSEATRYAVVYKNGVKQSVEDRAIIPNYVLFEPKALLSLPIYQKKATLLDALCQACESWWNINSTEESIEYSKKAIALIVENMDSYINSNSIEAASKIMKAANFAGKAINITATTAAHAMSYKITSMYGIPHGNAVAVCFPEVWAAMLYADENLHKIFNNIATQLGQSTSIDAINWFKSLLDKWEMRVPKSNDRNSDIEVLTKSVNTLRLKNNPVQFNEDEIRKMYSRIVK